MYWCSYCQSQHEDNTKGEEHIIPKSLLNKKYVLDTTCRYWNQYMSHSFEQKVLYSELMQYVLDIFAPKKPKRPAKLGEVFTEDGTMFPLFRVGRQEFMVTSPKPNEDKTNRIPIKITDPDDSRVIEFMLRLPFEYTTTLSGANKLLTAEKRKKKIEADNARLQKYLDDLCKNPEINQEFYAFFKKHALDKQLEKTGNSLLSDIDEIDEPDKVIENVSREFVRILDKESN